MKLHTEPKYTTVLAASVLHGGVKMCVGHVHWLRPVHFLSRARNVQLHYNVDLMVLDSTGLGLGFNQKLPNMSSVISGQTLSTLV